MTDALRSKFVAAAVGRPHVLVAGVPGYANLRIAAEAAAVRHRAVFATSAADADVLLIAGPAGPQLTQAVDVVWAQLPGPRARIQVSTARDLDDAFAVAVEALADTDAQRADAQARANPWNSASTPHADRADDDMHGGPDMGSMGGEMEMPGGLMMADRAEDRDGLKLDVLHVPLGPFLPGWPAGLVVHTQLQGDLIQAAHTEVLDEDLDHSASAEAHVGDRDRAVAALDALAGLLMAADWRYAAAATRALRDDVLADPNRADLSVRARHLSRRVARSRLLRARGTLLGIVDANEAPDLAGDATARWLRWLAVATGALEIGSTYDVSSTPQPAATTLRRLELAANLIVGLDLAAARVLIASLEIRPGDQPASMSDPRVTAGA